MKTINTCPYEPPRAEIVVLGPLEGILADSVITGMTNTESFDMSDVVSFP